MKKRLTFGLLAALFVLSSCCSYNAIMKNALKKSMGKDFKGYYAFSYPTNNFGLITSYENELAQSNQYCAMAACLDGIEINNETEWLHLGDLADVGDGAAIDLSEKKKTKIAVDAVLPKLWNAVQIDGSVSNDREVKTTLQIGPAHVRFINKKKFEEYIENLPQTNKYKQKYNAGNLVLIVSDVVVESLSVRIEVDNTLATKLDAAIASGSISKNLGDVDLKATLEKTTSGVYELKIDKPVIVLRLAKKQNPIKGTGVALLGNQSDNFDNWVPVKDYIEK